MFSAALEGETAEYQTLNAISIAVGTPSSLRVVLKTVETWVTASLSLSLH